MLDPKYIPLFIGGFIAWICFMIFVGWITSRGKNEGSSFLTGGGNLGFFLIFCTVGATMIGTGSSMGAIGNGFNHGWGGAIYGLGASAGILSMLLFTKAKNKGFLTMSEEAQYYYGGKKIIRQVMGFMMFVIEIIWLGNHLNGGAKYLAYVTQLPDVTSADIAVVELSSFQLISMRKSPKVAVVTNVTPNHLDHHKDMQEYIDAKRNILLWQEPPCRAVLGYENDITRSMAADCKGEQFWFTRLHETDHGAFLRESDDTLCYAENGVVTPVLPRAEVKLRGLHNVENLLAAIAAVWGRVPVDVMRQVGSTFTGVEHRIEPVRVLDGVTYYNDSIASSPTRTIAGLRSFDQKIILIAGGYDKKIPYEPLAPEIVAHVKVLVLMGATAPRIEKAVREDPNFDPQALPILHADSMQHAVELARGAAKPGDIVSLSPASASFDLYPNFEVRGRDYKRIVNELQ